MTNPANSRVLPKGSPLIETKLYRPLLREGFIPRPELVGFMREGFPRKLTLVSAPAGYGKTTLLAQWHVAEVGNMPFAWVTLDAYDNDPSRFWTYIIKALHAVEPEVGANSLAALKGSTSLVEHVLPLLINELASLRRVVVLVLDDYHHVRNGECHESMRLLLDNAPPTLHVVISTRVEPPLRLGVLRSRGELSEVRAEKLGFTSKEASELLNEAMTLDLAAADIDRLMDRTEGWAAGLYLAGLSLPNQADAHDFVETFAGDSRNVMDYLIEEVIRTQPDDVVVFLRRSSILERLSGSLCDAIVGRAGSAEFLRLLERSNLFLVPLDERREWYRYHHLFRDLLRLELRYSEPELVPVLHSRASAWYRDSGAVDEAIRHAIAATDTAEAAELIAQHWLSYVDAGQAASVWGWLDGLPEESLTNDPRLCMVMTWLSALAGNKENAEHFLSLAQAGHHDGPLPDGTSSVESGAALIHALYVFDGARRACESARRAVELETDETSPWRALAHMLLGYCLYWSGELSEAEGYLKEAARFAEASEQHLILTNALSLLSFVEGQRDNLDEAEALACRALEVIEENLLTHTQQSWSAYVAFGKVLTGRGELARAERMLEHGLELQRLADSSPELTGTLLALASVRGARGAPKEARALVEEACEIIEGCVDAGILSSLLERTERSLRRALRQQPGLSEELSEREAAVLKLLGTKLTKRQISAELYLSFNTVKSHTRAIYRKLGVSSRTEAVAQARLYELIS
jgi:LuxR family maltose regulon positive regulatory protein